MTYSEGKGHKEATAISGHRPNSHHSGSNMKKVKKGHNETD